MSKYYGSDRINVPSGYVDMALKHAEKSNDFRKLKVSLPKGDRDIEQLRTKLSELKGTVHGRRMVLESCKHAYSAMKQRELKSGRNKYANEHREELRRAESKFFTAVNEYNQFITQLSPTEKMQLRAKPGFLREELLSEPN